MKDRSSFVAQAFCVFCTVLLLVFSAGSPLAAQQPVATQQPVQSPLQPLSPDQLDTLVAPIALYPDALLSQVLVASTYPLELVEAGQWLQQNQSLQGTQLVDAARQQNWDPSIQALVVFPDVIERLNSDIRWTTDLGNAFLAQQADVMNAVQRMRAEARAEGKLTSNTEETIATDTQGGQTAIEIQPTNPEVIYVPTYNPEDVWGPPGYGYYPPLDYPGVGFGFGYGPGIYLGGFFGGLGFGGWGWGPNWFNCSIFENGGFFNRYGFRGFDDRGFGDRGFGGRGTWAHNPEHRLGVAYPNQGLANRYGGNFGGRGSGGMQSARSTGGLNGAGNGSLGNRANFGAGAAQRGQFAGGRMGSGRLGGSQSQPNYRTNPANGGSTAYRSSPSSGGFGGARTMPAPRSTKSYGGSGFRSTPSSGGAGFRSTPSYGGAGFRSTQY